MQTARDAAASAVATCPCTASLSPLLDRKNPGLIGSRIPYLHLAQAPRGDACAVGGDRDAGDQVGVPLEGEHLLSRLRVPHLHRLVIAPRHDPFAVGGDRHPADREGVILEW